MKQIQLAQGDSVIFLSDGLVDAMNRREEILGIEGVMNLLNGCRERWPNEILRKLFAAVEEHSRRQAQQDDRTAAVVRYTKG